MAKLQEGKPAPDFSLPSTEGEPIRLSELKGKNVVLYFYPKDNTPGCTKESCDFRDSIKKIEAQDTLVLGVSADSVESHEKFRKQYKLPFPLLSDESKEVIKKYDVWKEKAFMGKKYMGIERTTVVIDKKGNVHKIFSKVKVDGHSKEILQTLESL